MTLRVFRSDALEEMVEAQSLEWTLGAAGLVGTPLVSSLYSPHDFDATTPPCLEIAGLLRRRIELIAATAVADESAYRDGSDADTVVRATHEFVLAAARWLEAAAACPTPISIETVPENTPKVIADEIISAHRYRT